MTATGTTVVVRMGALGDIVLSAAITAQLAPVTYVTHTRWVDVARRLPGVVTVVGWPSAPLPRNVDRVVDLQADLRARVLVARMSARHVAHVQRHDWARRARVWLKTDPAPRVVDRYATAAGVAVAPRPWLARLPPADHVVFVPGARWQTKRWPDRHWADLGRRWPGPITVVGGPGDEARVEAIAEAIGSRASPLAERGFARTWPCIASARAVVAGDTGLMHVAGAMGVPLVALFGSTHSADGFWCHDGVVVERALGCRPCSRHGRARCPLQHRACLTGLEPARVHDALRQVLEVPCGTSS